MLLKGLYLLGKKIYEMGMDEFFDGNRVREALKELYVLLEAGKISEEEFESREEELVGRLEQIESYKNS
jgi:uncharacterized membrane protein